MLRLHCDSCVDVDPSYNGAQPDWIVRRVDLQWNDLHVGLFDPPTGQPARGELHIPPRRVRFGVVQDSLDVVGASSSSGDIVGYTWDLVGTDGASLAHTTTARPVLEIDPPEKRRRVRRLSRDGHRDADFQ